MKKRSFAGKSALAALGLFGSLDVYAFGLGQIEVFSALNEPFSAEIPLTAVRDNERESLRAELAPAQEFDRAGLERSFALMQLSFDVIERDGQPRILISSRQPVREPFLNFLIMATSGDGRILREYTVLLDPPRGVFADSRTTVAPATTTSRPETTSQTVTSPTRQITTTDAKHRGSAYGPTDRSDTLWAVAMRTRPSESISVQQMAMALFEANPNAFNNNNVNGLRAGQTLTIPSLSEIEANWSDQRARAAFSEHQTRWRNQTTAPSVATQASDTAPTATAAATDNDVAATAEAESQQQTVSDDSTTQNDEARLRLVAATETSQDNDSQALQGDPELLELSEQLTLAQETIEAQAQENIDFRARMDAMESQLETLRRMIAIKDADLARLQSLAEGSLSEGEFTAESITDEFLDDYALANNFQRDDDIAAYESASADNDTSPATDEANETLINQTAETFGLDQQEVRGVIARVSQFANQNRLEVMLGALLILLILWLIARRRKQGVTWNEAMQDMERPVVVKPAADMAEQAEQDASVQDNETTEQSAPVRVKSVSELVEQADMFVGYADYVQARSSLEQARVQEPANLLVAYKLLFVLFKQHKTDEFIGIVEASSFDESSEEWSDIVGWGRQLAPHHERFAEADESAIVEEAAVVPEAIDDEISAVIEETDDSVIESEDHQAEPDHIEFDLDAFKLDDDESTTTVSSDEVLREPDETLDFNTAFDLDESDEDKPADLTDEEIESDDDSTGLPFDVEPLSVDSDDSDSLDELRIDIEDFDLDPEAGVSDDAETTIGDSSESDDLDINFGKLAEPPVEPEAEDQALSSFDSDDEEVDLEFNLDEFDAIDEAETKLDLAAAYIDMEDLTGARSILQEVLQEGNEEQQARAQELLDSLS